MQDKKIQLKKLETKLSNSFQEEANSWVGKGISFYKISQLIDPNNDASTEWKKITGWGSFSKYLMYRWGYENPHKGIKERIAAKNLLENKPELWDKYKSKRFTKIPGFSILYQLETMKDSVDEVEWKSLLKKVYSGEITRKDLEEMVSNTKQPPTKSFKSKKGRISTPKTPYKHPYKYSDENFNDEDYRNEYFNRESFLLKDIPSMQDKVNRLFPGEQGEKLCKLINQMEDECRSIIFKADAA